MSASASESMAQAAQHLEDDRKRLHSLFFEDNDVDGDGHVEEKKRSAKRPRFNDPVLQSPPEQPVVLTQCGHTVDGSYLNKLLATAKERGKVYGYACPTCNTISMRVVRNYALEEQLGLDTSSFVEPETGLVKSLAQKESFRSTSEELAALVVKIDEKRLKNYLSATEWVIRECVLPSIRASYETTFYSGKKPNHQLSVIPSANLYTMFRSAASFLAWYSYDNHRYEHELVESHGITLKVKFWKRDAALTKSKKDTSTWYNLCKSTDIENAWNDAAITFDYCTREDHRNC